MNRKQLIFLLGALIIIGGAGLVLLNRNKESWAQPEAKMGDKVLPHFQPNEVAAIHIKGSSELNLVHRDDVWRVRERNGYPANFHQISDTLIKLKDLKVVESETADPSDLPRVNLGEPGKEGGGTLVEFKDGQGKVIDSLLVGKKHARALGDSTRSSFMNSEPDGCYILLPKDPKDVLLISDALGSLQANPRQWLSKDFIKVEKVKSIVLALPDVGPSWKLSRESESARWLLANAGPDEKLDEQKIRLMANTLATPAFVDVLSSNNSTETGLDKPKTVTIETFDPLLYTIKIGAKSPEGNYYLTVAVAAGREAKADDQPLREKLKQEQALAPWIYTVGSWIMDPLLRDRAQLLQGYDDGTAAKPAAARNPNPVPGAPGWTPHVIQ